MPFVIFVGREQYRAFDKLFYDLVDTTPTSLKTQVCDDSPRSALLVLAFVKTCVKKALGAADHLSLTAIPHRVCRKGWSDAQ
jgi:hypothetical protein